MDYSHPYCSQVIGLKSLSTAKRKLVLLRVFYNHRGLATGKDDYHLLCVLDASIAPRHDCRRRAVTERRRRLIRAWRHFIKLVGYEPSNLNSVYCKDLISAH